MPPTIIRERMAFIDALRGLVMMLMALDHVRDFFGPTPFDPLDLAQTSPGWFLTRYATHFCAPVFVFLTGVGAWLYGQQVNPQALRRYLWTRGLWLIFLECTWVGLSWGGVFGGHWFFQVIWALGVGMIALSLLSRLPRMALALLALSLVAGHNLFDTLHVSDMGSWGWLWSLLHEPHYFRLGWGETSLFILYPLIPWVAVMALGYVFAPVMQMSAPKRERTLLLAACSLFAVLLVCRSGNFYGDPHPWSEQARGLMYSGFSFMNFQKYPPSLLYLCMTLGGGALLLALFARLSEHTLRHLLVFGRVPMFFYLLHIPLIHLGANAWFLLRYGQLASMNPRHPTPGYEPGLLWVYAVWIGYLCVLYVACRWYGSYKRQHQTNRSWLRYL